MRKFLFSRTKRANQFEFLNTNLWLSKVFTQSKMKGATFTSNSFLCIN